MQLVFNIPVAYIIPGSTKLIPIVNVTDIAMEAIYDSQRKDVFFYQNNTQLLMKTGTSEGDSLYKGDKVSLEGRFSS